MIVSPAGKIDSELVEKTASIFTGWGFRVAISPHALGESGRFSGSVQERLSDLQSAMDDPEIKAIFCSRGGYGVVHLLDKLDFKGIKKHPKWLVGYSDITALHATFQKNGVMSMHGPMAKHFADEGDTDFAVRQIKSVLEHGTIDYLVPTTGFQNLNRPGKDSGLLFGGNLAVFCGLLGTGMMRIPESGILFIEDIGEEPYKIDRYIYQLKLSGIFNRISGLMVGRFTDYVEDDNMYAPLLESISAAVSEYDFPILFNFPIGHVKENLPVIMGKSATLEVGKDQANFKQM